MTHTRTGEGLHTSQKRKAGYLIREELLRTFQNRKAGCLTRGGFCTPGCSALRTYYLLLTIRLLFLASYSLLLTPYPYSLLLTSYFLPTPYSFPYSITARLVARLPGSKEGRCGFVHHVAATAKVPKLVHRGAEMVVGAAQALPQVGDASYILPEGVLP